MVHLARRGFQHCAVYCLLPPALVYFAVLQPGLFSVYCHMHFTATRTTFSELPQALCWSAIVFSATRAVISLLPNILWCHSLLALDVMFPGAVTMTKLAFLLWMLSLVSWWLLLLPTYTSTYDQKERWICSTFVCYVRSLFLWKKVFEDSKENFLSGHLKCDEVPGNFFFIPWI